MSQNQRPSTSVASPLCYFRAVRLARERCVGFDPATFFFVRRGLDDSARSSRPRSLPPRRSCLRARRPDDALSDAGASLASCVSVCECVRHSRSAVVSSPAP